MPGACTIQKSIKSCGTEVTNDCKLSCGFWEPNTVLYKSGKYSEPQKETLYNVNFFIMKGLPIPAKETGWGFWSAVLWPSMYEDLGSTAVKREEGAQRQGGGEDGRMVILESHQGKPVRHEAVTNLSPRQPSRFQYLKN